MAQFELKFLDCLDKKAYVQTEIRKNIFDKNEDVISIFGVSDTGNRFCLWIDKSTAIKFAKTLRTEINKMTEKEGEDGGR
tara:strand:- start:359 stop:598 length:240 start_codon:yes stop_codon:yes gene_type:complete